MDMIRPKESSCPEYITLVKFDSCENLIRWKESPILAKWLEKLPDLVVGDSLTQERVGLEPWFDRPGIPQRLKEPPIWKQVFIGVICVYPLILLLNLVLAPLTGGLPGKLALLLNVVFLSTFLAYPVMPWVTGLLKTWLYPK